MGNAEISAPWDPSEPGDMVCWEAPWHQQGCRSPRHGTAAFPTHGQCQGCVGSAARGHQSLLSMVAFSSVRCCG